MQEPFGRKQRLSLENRGFSRRDFGRVAALLTAGAALPFYNEPALAQDLKAIANIPPDAVRINANENPMGPCPAALEAAQRVLPQAGRYLFSESRAFVEALAAAEGISDDYIMPSAGSSDPLHRAVLAFTSPSRPLVTANPGYEAPSRAAEFIGAKTVQVPLRRDYSHDPHALVQAHPSTGLIYICNPNNPTGTVTRLEDIEYVVANKPEGCVVLLDEAYIHFSTSTSSGMHLVAADKDVIILRTFSKLYGMAGLRAGAAFARPDLLEKLLGYSGLPILPATGMAAATASLKQKSLVAERRRAMADVREDVCAWLQGRGYAFIPSEANMVLIDSKRPGREMAAAMLKHKVAIGRAWPALPTYVRITIGTPDEMAKFKSAFDRVMNA
jgi:histidinol-phosphate aminotransferase